MAAGYYPRRRVRPGYLRCAICKRDLPEEEFRATQRAFGADRRTVKTYRVSYCNPCNAAYSSERRAASIRLDPTYHDRERQRQRDNYRRGEGAEAKREARERTDQAHDLLQRMLALGLTKKAIHRNLGLPEMSVARWSRKEGKPTAAHIARLKAEVARLVAILEGS